MSDPRVSTIRWRDLVTGFLFFAGIAIAAVLFLVVGRNSPVLYKFVTIHIFVQNVEGLVENNFVAISGRKVGTVSAMTITTKNDTVGVEVDLMIRGEFADKITKDSKASLKSIGVLGDKFVDISLGNGEKVKQDDFIDVTKEAGLGDITGTVGRVSQKVEILLDKINGNEGSVGKLVNTPELAERLNRVLTNLETASAKLNGSQGTMGQLLNNGDLAARLNSTVKNLEDVTGNLKSGKGSLGKLMVDETFYNSLSATSQRLDSLVGKLNNPNGSLSRLADNPALYNNISRSAGALDTLLRDLKENPSRYVNVRVF
jgi:phospholipid/cholesterol/gamma-HCH transport system substrate-binding protein